MLALGDVTPDSPGFDRLRADASAGGHFMLDRFAIHWRDGSNRFDRPGERITGARLGFVAVSADRITHRRTLIG